MPAEVSARLLVESVALFQSEKSKRNFEDGFCAGQIKTKRQQIRFFGVQGIGFEAEIEYETDGGASQSSRVVYIVTPRLLGMEISFCSECGDMILSDPLDTIGPTIGSC